MTKPKLIENCRYCGDQFAFSKNVFYCSLLCRFYDNIEKSSECWEWRGSRGSHGYGQLNIDGKITTTHRLSWEIHNGPIPDKALVCHTCDNRGCVNPSHLFLGTHKDNQNDMAKKGRSARKYSKKMIRRVKEKISNKVPYKQIAKEEGTSDTWVRCVANGEIHVHI